MEKASAPLVHILILNYNGRRFLDDCFRSVLQSTYPNFRVMMIDNKSTDDSVAYTRANYPEVEIFENPVNAGFSLAYNNAFKVARGKYYVILNNDVTVEPGWLEPLVEEAERDPSVGALQPKLLSMLERHKFEYAGACGGHLDKYGYPFARGRVFDHVEEDRGQYDDVARIFWASGAAMFVRASILKETGGLDEDFIHHMEEIDLCYRINLRGYQLKSVPASIVYHYGGGIITYESYKKIYWNHRNSVLMMLKNLERGNLLRIIPVRILLDAMTAGWSLTRLDVKRIAALCHAYLWLLMHTGLILRKRKEVKALRKVDDREIMPLLYPRSVALQYFLFGRKTYMELMEAIGNQG